MAYGVILGANKTFFWNIDGHVGPGCPNRVDDVQLVQYGYYCMARNPGLALSPQEKAAYNAVVPGAPYAGNPSDPLTVAIREHQRARGGTQDGRVSPIGNTSGSYGEKSWMLVPLCNNIKDHFPQMWPLLHRCQQCPMTLAAMSRQTFS